MYGLCNEIMVVCSPILSAHFTRYASTLTLGSLSPISEDFIHPVPLRRLEESQ